MSSLFLVFVVVIIVFLSVGIVRYLPVNYKLPGLAALAVWIAYGGALGYNGVISNTSILPPGIFYLLVPIVLMVMIMASSNVGKSIAQSFPIWMLMGMESFRVVVEVFLHQLWQYGQVPKMLTYEGANFDILIGISAPVAAWLFASGRISNRVALTWNAIGLLMLANVVVRAILTSPGPLHFISTEVPNVSIGTFPFTYIPGLMVPLALVLHVLSIRALRLNMKNYKC